MMAQAALTSAAGVCDQAAQIASRQIGVPAEILQAIGRVESGRQIGGQLQPWPWTVNLGGAGAFFVSAQEAEDHVTRAMNAGQSNIDIGCFQINLHWHGAAFESVADMMQPLKNAVYAAKFLLELKARHGTWDGAVGAYHSGRSDAAAGYLAKVAAQLDEPLSAPGMIPAVAPTAVSRANHYPLLQPGSGVSVGSLVATDRGQELRPLFQ